MSDGVTIGVGEAYPFLEQRVLQIFGKDAATIEETKWLRSLHETAVQIASKIQCVGMPGPVPFEDIYQPTHLFRKGIRKTSNEFAYDSRTQRSFVMAQAERFRPVSFDQLLSIDDDALIFAGPGWGKSTFLNSVFRVQLRNDDVWPVMISLRRPNSVTDVEEVVRIATKIKSKSSRSKLMLLVDGYDEIPAAERRLVSEALLRYQALKIGNFYLTCREYYSIFQLTAPEVRLGGFTKEDKYKFVRAFMKAFESPLDPIEVVNYFEDYGFSDLLSHPLLLTLACIVQTSIQTINPRSGLKLLSSALNVLSFRWDEQKGIRREEDIALDGEDRLQILRKIAHGAKTAFVPGLRAVTTAKQELTRMAHDKVDPRKVLEETAQFYGILVPSDDGWEFVHRTLQDFLAAQYAVMTGEFARKIRHEWNARTAYSACLMDDATEVLISALASDEGLSTAAEILDNTSRYDPKRVSKAVIMYFDAPRRSIVVDIDAYRVSGQLSSDFLRFSNTRLLNQLIEDCISPRTPERDLLVGCCVFEFVQRQIPCEHSIFYKALDAYKTDRFTFNLAGLGQVALSSVRPN
jgi:hypothetical protein